MNVIFDIADVLLDWQIDIMLAGITEPTDRAKASKEIMEHNDWLELDRGRISMETALPRFIKRTGLPHNAIERLMAAIPDSLIPNPDALALLDEVDRSKHRLFCLSNLHMATWEEVRSRYDFWDKFEGIVISCYVGCIKPEPEIYRLILNKYGLAAEESVFIDDRPVNIAGAQSVGLKTILFKNAADCSQKLAAALASKTSH